ncbi:HesA/MoeB/ThiF family protein [Chitinimonas arctica]|uniref:HesA/MoeB/ThiF family protein n=1 Tax=Chitinimonas arctica TaxID=2594795 RepID=A0A516SLI9_9NEIS|nr:HesA/MoeB/ThiF family protein [Chitinimonas arctica]QDQ28878.1 HesA/MoeB/ThiF family protein [Chitinimonas arctica]
MPELDLSDDELLRYSRHILLDEIGIEGQTRLASATALIVGLGGLGSPAALYLASAGVGRLVLADADKVELSNLQRQIVHRQDTVGQLKVDSARQTLAGANSLVEVVALPERLAGDALHAAVASADVVLDCSDNFPTRHAVNRACVATATPLVSGAAVRFDGQFAVFDPRQADSPCYRCLFAEEGDVSDGPCATFGVFAPLVGIIGAMQAAEALKLLIGMGGAPLGRLLTLDLRSHEWRSLRFAKDPACPVCAQLASL